MTAQYAILGYPLGHSISPDIHNRAFEFLDIPARYTKRPIAPDQFDEEIKRLKNENWCGFNITIPFKERILEFMDETEPLAARIGAVNTVKIDQHGRWLGFNTDYRGFLEPIRNDLPRIKSILMLGAGGAGRAVFSGLMEEARPEQFYIANRAPERAQQLIEQLGKTTSTQFHMIPITGTENIRCRFDLMINTTALGIAGHEEITTFDPAGLMKPDGIVYDLVYNPPRTALIKKSREAGIRTFNGLPMLLGQAAAAFKIWTGQDYPAQIYQQIFCEFDSE
jgi:shikimate dehydrogenase